MEQRPISIDDLMKIIGELTVQLRISNQMVIGLNQEKIKLEEELRKIITEGETK